MKETLLNEVKKIARAKSGRLIRYRRFGKTVSYRLVFPDTDIELSMQRKKGGAL